MIRLTVLYNLPAGADEEAFVAWRLTAHADYIKRMPGVVKADFGRIVDQWSTGEAPGYRFQSTIEWPDRASFERAFYNEQAQADLKKNDDKIGDSRFLVTEILAGG
jgi:uncharacterized protein (TIGR02118 family)